MVGKELERERFIPPILSCKKALTLFLAMKTDGKTMRFSVGEEYIFFKSFHQTAWSNHFFLVDVFRPSQRPRWVW